MSIDTKPEPHDDAGPFLMTPAQHRERLLHQLEQLGPLFFCLRRADHKAALGVGAPS